MAESYQRELASALDRALLGAPVVVLTGARQVGKTTLVQRIGDAPQRRFASLDHLPTLARARSEPEALVAEHERLTIDEVQRAPDLMLAIKHEVDRSRRNGRFLLTGSANLLLIRSIGESLAGRATYLTLRALTESEKRGDASERPWGALLEAADSRAALAGVGSIAPVAWRAAALTGGFPPAALARSAAERHQWFDGYATTYVTRDLRELAQVDDLAGFGRLLQLVALRSGGLLNQANLARDAGLPRSTVQRWLSLLVASYLAVLVPPFFESRAKRLVRSPKIYPGDTGLALHLAGIYDEAALERSPRPGAWLESVVLNDLLAWSETQVYKPALMHYRASAGQEIDFIVERSGRYLPVEVKASRAVRPDDAQVCEAFCEEFGERAPFALVLYDGTESVQISRRTIALPLGAVL